MADKQDYGLCDKCGTKITFPPLCNNDDCELSWKGYEKAITKNVAEDIPDDDPDDDPGFDPMFLF